MYAGKMVRRVEKLGGRRGDRQAVSHLTFQLSLSIMLSLRDSVYAYKIFCEARKLLNSCHCPAMVRPEVGALMLPYLQLRCPFAVCLLKSCCKEDG
jgi:hypothetical protein